MKVLPKPPGMTESGKKKRIGDGHRERMTEKEKGGEKERNLMEYSENGTWRLKGFLRATHSRQITDLFGDRVYIEVRMMNIAELTPLSLFLSWML